MCSVGTYIIWTLLLVSCTYSTPDICLHRFESGWWNHSTVLNMYDLDPKVNGSQPIFFLATLHFNNCSTGRLGHLYRLSRTHVYVC
ncbi:hypothetical protein F5B22DRAFT_604880, partial [Xylaria bambusicola]|uniref:uncharacterized protein n=1 Tax=Xylaria bambusicola TaxID=326684 RepID=UPI002008DD7D